MKRQVVPVVVMSLVLAALWTVAARVRASDPFTVNTTTAGDQEHPDVAFSADGRSVVVWQSENQDGDDRGVFARWFDWKGVALTGEVQVNTETVGSQHGPRIDGDDLGNFVIVWDDSNSGIRARMFDANGVALTVELDAAGPAPSPFEPSVSVNGDGHFVVTWLAADGHDRYVGARRYDPDGTPLGATISVAAYTHPIYFTPEGTGVELLADRSFLAVWTDGEEVYGRPYDSQGDPTAGQFQVSQLDYPYSFHSMGVDVAAEGVGRYRVVWATDINLEETTVMTRTVSPPSFLGTLTDLWIISSDWPGPGFSMTGDGDFVVTRIGGYWPWELEAQRFDKHLNPLAQHNVIDNLPDGWCASRVAHGGRDSREFIVVWQEPPMGDPSTDIRARIFSHAIFRDGFESGDTAAWITRAAIPMSR